MYALQLIFSDEDNNLEPFSYSGRGMGGKRCVAVRSTLEKVLAAIIYGVTDSNREELAEACRRVETDNLGHDIVVYFPYVEFEEEEDESDEDESEESEV